MFPLRNKLINIFDDLGLSKFSANFYLLVNYSFNMIVGIVIQGRFCLSQVKYGIVHVYEVHI